MIKRQYIPRIEIKMNTGTRVIQSKRDKQRSRRSLNKQLRDMLG